jgi:hypothetical protein
MPIIIDTGALLRPLFTADQFTATQWETAQGKADFGNKLCKFIAADFKQSLFTKTLYGRLRGCLRSNSQWRAIYCRRQSGRCPTYGLLGGKIRRPFWVGC